MRGRKTGKELEKDATESYFRAMKYLWWVSFIGAIEFGIILGFAIARC